MTKLGATYQSAVFEIPMKFLMLMMRQELYSQGEPGITLSEQEWVDETFK